MSGGRFSIIPAHALDDARLSPAALRVLAILGTYGDKEGWCFPSQSTIARRLGVSRAAVQKQIEALQVLGYVEIRKRFRDDGGQSSNEYRLIFDRELPGLFDRDPPQLQVAGGQPQVAGAATPEVAPPATPEVAPYNEPKNVPLNGKRARATSLPEGFGVSEAVKAWAEQKGFTPFLQAHLEYFVSYAKATGKTYKDWDQAFMNCIRADWGGVRKQALKGQPSAKPGGVALTCEFRGKQWAPDREPCGMPAVGACVFYGGRQLCEHHKREIETTQRAPMPADVRERLGLTKRHQPEAT